MRCADRRPGEAKRGRAGAAARAAGRALAGLASLAALAAAIGYAWLASAPGAAWLEGKVLSRVNGRIPGRLEAGAFRVHGLSFDASDLALSAPSGEVVARASRLAGVPLLPLARGRIVLDGSRLVGLAIAIEPGPSGAPPPLLSAVGAPRAGGAKGGLEARRIDLSGASIAVGRLLSARGLGGSVRHEGEAWTFELGGGSGVLAGVPFQSLSVEAAAGRDGIEVSSVKVELPGARATASGTVRNGAIAAEAQALVADVGALWGALQGGLGGAGGSAIPPLGGAGRLRATARGPLRDPAVAFDGAFDAASAGRAALRGLHLEGAVERAGAPLAAARFLASAEEARVGARSLGPWRADLRARGGRVELGASLGRRLTVRGSGRASADGHASWLDALAVRGPAGAWRLARPAPIAVRGGVVDVGRLSLRSGSQRVTLAARLGGGRVRARAVLRGVELGAIAAALPAAPALAGRASGLVAASGTTADPRVSADLRVERGPIPRLARFTARVHATRAPGGALRGTARLDGLGAHATARFETDDVLLSTPREAPLAATVRAEGPLAALATIGLAVPASARVRAVARLEGTLRAPRIQASADVRGLRVGGVAGALHLDGGHSPGRSWVRARGAAAGGAVAFDGELVGAPGSMRLSARLRVEHARLGALLAAAPWVQRAAGRIDADLRASGGAARPRIEGTLTVREGSIATSGSGRYSGITLDARAEGDRLTIERLAAESGGGRLVASARGVRRGDVLDLEASGRIEAFPIVTRSRLRARAVGDVALSATLARSGLAGALEIRRAEARLPPRVGKVLPGPRPADVKVVDEDAPIARWDPPDPPPPPRTRTFDPARATIRLALTTAAPVRVRGPGIDLRAEVEPGFGILYERGWGFLGKVGIPDGTLRILGSPVALLRGSELRFSGPASRPYLALALRGGFEADSVLVLHGYPGDLQLGLPPAGTTQDEILAALQRMGPDRGGGSSMGGPLPLVGVRLPFANLLEAPAASSYEAGTPLTRRLRVESSGRLGADRRDGENSSAASLQLRIGPHTQAQVSAGDAGAASADLLVTHRRMPPRPKGWAAGWRAPPRRPAGSARAAPPAPPEPPGRTSTARRARYPP